MKDVQNKPTTQKWIKLLQLEHKRVLAARIPESSGLHKIINLKRWGITTL